MGKDDAEEVQAAEPEPDDSRKDVKDAWTESERRLKEMGE
jgi:hypothetical protein